MSERSPSCSGDSSGVFEHRTDLSWPRFLALAVVAAGALPVIFGPGVWAQRPVFRTGVHTVAVYATVQDSNGRLVPDLPREAFQIFENGRPVEITAFSRDPQPLRVAVMLDASWSGGPFKWVSELRNSIFAFMRALGPDDRASLGTFGGEIAVGANLTNDLAEFERVLREEYWTGLGAGTPLWQAVGEASTSLSGQSGRHVVLVYTDGQDSGSLPNWRGNRSTVERQVVREDAMIYVVRPAWMAEARRQRSLPASVAALAEASGGGHFEVPEGADLPAAFTRIAEELRHQYLLGFSPAVLDGKEHKIDVRVSRPNLKVRARRSHAARSAPAPAAATAVKSALEAGEMGVTWAGVVPLGRSEYRSEGALTAVVLLDATWTVANTMAPFVWDGSYSEFSRRPIFTNGRRLPHRPADLFMAGVIEGLLPNLEPGDRLRLGTISRQFRLSTSFTGDRAALTAAARDVLNVPDADRYGPSPLWDAVDEALTILREEPGRRAIILVTDGMPTGNRLGLSHVQGRAALLGIPIYVLDQALNFRARAYRIEDRTGNPWMFLQNPLGDSPGAMIKSLADVTGGAYFVEDSVGGTGKDAEGKLYPDPEAGRPRTLIKQFERMMREIQKTRTSRATPAVRGRSEQAAAVRTNRP